MKKKLPILWLILFSASCSNTTTNTHKKTISDYLEMENVKKTDLKIDLFILDVLADITVADNIRILKELKKVFWQEKDYDGLSISTSNGKRQPSSREIYGNTVHSLSLLLVSSIAACSTITAFVFFLLYRRKDTAYKKLAQKTRMWIHEYNHSIPLPPNEEACPAEETCHTEKTGCAGKRPTPEDEQVFSLIRREVQVRRTYRETGLTVEILADRLGMHRNTLSRAVNRMTGDNFSQYVNRLRVQETIRIMEDKEHKEIYLYEILESVGFASRAPFYRAFKQFTGLSPIEYMKNKNIIPAKMVENTFTRVP